MTRERADQRRLARSVPADDREPVAPVQLEVDRAQGERGHLDDGAGELDDPAGRWRGRELELEPPRRPRLLDLLETLQVVPRLRDLSAQGVRRPATGLPGPDA